MSRFGRSERHLLDGRVRECSQFSLEDDQVFRWDFAYRDPSSGEIVQLNTLAWVRPDIEGKMHEGAFGEQVRGPAIARLAWMIERKCGIGEAVRNQFPLELPRTAAVARFV